MNDDALHYDTKLGSIVLDRAELIVWLDLPLLIKLWRLAHRAARSCACAPLARRRIGSLLWFMAADWRPSQVSQFSTRRRGTRENSATLLVTIVRPSARACAAMMRSLGPMGYPAASKPTRISA